MPEIRVQVLDVTFTLQYRNLMLQGFQDHPDAFTSTFEERKDMPPEWWQARLGALGQSSLVVGALQADGSLIGVAGLEFNERTRTRHVAVLFGMHVDSEFRHRGVGQCLVDSVLETARADERLSVVQLTVSEGNGAADRLYQRSGFEAFGFEPRAIRSGDTYLGKRHLWIAV